MDIILAAAQSAKADIIGLIARALNFPDYARSDNWDSFEECLADALESRSDRVTIHILASPKAGSPVADLISILTELRVEHENLSFVVGNVPHGPTDTEVSPSTKGEAVRAWRAVASRKETT